MHQRRLLMCAAIVLMEMTVCTHLGVQFVLISTLTAVCALILMPNTEPNTPTREIQALIKENSQLCQTVHRMSEEHQMLCEIRSTLAHVRRTSNELLYTAQQTHKALQKQLPASPNSTGSSSSTSPEQHPKPTEGSAPPMSRDEHKANRSPTMKRSNSGRSLHPDMQPESTRAIAALRFNKSDSRITYA